MRSWYMHGERFMDGGEKHMRVMQVAASSQPASLTGCRATGVWATSPVDRTAAREDHLGGHSGGRVGLQEEHSSRHAVTN